MQEKERDVHQRNNVAAYSDPVASETAAAPSDDILASFLQ